MESNFQSPPLNYSARLLSIDFFRGIIMLILMLGETDIFLKIYEAFPGKVTFFLYQQFSHSEWEGLHFWDLLLPAFMFVAGISMAMSYNKQQKIGVAWSTSFKKILKRCFWLFFWGVLIYAVKGNHINLQFSNVLVELAVATLISFLIINLNIGFQLIVSIIILLATELLFRFSNISGFNQPFVDLHNFANYIDVILIGRVNPHYGTTFNVIPSSVSTIFGLIVGEILLKLMPTRNKILYLTSFGFTALIFGIFLNSMNITPILKWVASSSFILTTAGIAILIFTFCFWWIDIKKHEKYWFLIKIVSLNSIFIYLFFNFISSYFLYEYMNILVAGILNLFGIPIVLGVIFGSFSVFIIEWYLCYFLYKKGIFFKL